MCTAPAIDKTTAEFVSADGSFSFRMRSEAQHSLSLETDMRRSALCLLMLLPALSACHSKVDDRLKAMEDRLAKVEQSIGEHQAITLKPGQTGYGLLATDFGRVAVALADVQPYAGGSRIVLDFGNPTTARLSGMTAKVEWGSNDAKGSPMTPSTVQSLNFVAPEPLPAGSWHQYSIDLPGVAPTSLGWVKLSAFDSGQVDLLSQ